MNSNLNDIQSKDISLISNEIFLSIYDASGKILKEKFKEITNKYDKMLDCFVELKCNYKFNDIHQILKKYGFKKILKTKMLFRKSFEYVYENNKIYFKW